MKGSLSKTASQPGLKTERLGRRIAQARAILLWERLWSALWPLSGVAALFAAAALGGLFLLTPPWLHGLVLAAALFAAALAAYAGFAGFHLPRPHDGARRLERDNALANRPLSEAQDRLAAGHGDPYTEELWAAHRARILAQGPLRLSLPRPGLWARDPRGLRFAALAVLAVAAFFAGPQWKGRLLTALDPATGAGFVAPTLDAWIDPPAYTGEAPVYLGKAKPKLSVPTGSILNLRLHNAARQPRLVLTPEAQNATEFRGKNGEWSANVKLTQAAEVRVRAGGLRVGDFDLTIIPDHPPVIAFAAAPSQTKQNVLKLAYTAGDDYGVVAVRAIIKPHGKPQAKPLIVDLPLSETGAKTLSQTAYRDLSEHPYAGMDVDMRLEAEDAAGQRGHSKTVRFRLPQRIFTDPLARALVEQRGILARDEMKGREPVAQALNALTLAPDRFYRDKTGVYLAIRSAYWSLKNVRKSEDLARTEDLLGQTALAIEQGGVHLAAAELRRLQQMLADAFARGAPQAEIDALLERYRQAMQRYMQMMAQNAQPGGQPLPPNAKVLSQDDLETLLKAIQQLAQTGSREQAAQMLAMLQSMLENMQMMAGNGEGQGQSPGDKAKNDAIKKLGDLMGRQRGLLDKTLREQLGKGDPRDGGPKGLAQQQNQLQQDLNKIGKGLEGQGQKSPDGMGRAGAAMGNAEQQLGSNDLGRAGGSEKNALEAMRSSADELAKSLLGQNGKGMSGAEDPLGRNQGARGGVFGDNVKVPDQMTIERAREILKELRKRAAERGRPQEELDYIDRLLKEF
jgi:uncharacterized protein (TIGR02302 family)